jgi:serine/threonine-protein kinase RsbW
MTLTNGTRPRGRVPVRQSAGIRWAEGEGLTMAPAVTGGPAGTGEDLIAAGLPCRAGLDRVHHASYPGVPEAVRAARQHVAGVLAGVPAAEDVVYAVSEVASNAVLHSRSGHPGGRFTVAVDIVAGALVSVVVTDQGGPWKDGGPDFYPHGLQIVRELAAAVRIDGGEDGRTVWALFPWETG